MLAAKFNDESCIELELEKLNYPLLGSPKIDGIRWMKPADSPMMSRSWKPLPKKDMQDYVTDDFAFLDGEAIVGTDPSATGLFNKSQSAIMTASDTQYFSLWVFDSWIDHLAPFSTRTMIAANVVASLRSKGLDRVFYLEHKELNSPAEVLAYEEAAIENGYEGIMLRSPNATYKFGRSTLKEQGLIKVKRFADAEAKVIGFEALERNTNEQVRDAFGLAKRSSHRSGKVQDNLLGRLLVRSERWGDFAIGSGFDVDTRVKIWEDQASYLGKTVTFKYQEHGTLEKPRMPIFKGFRPEVD
jgi:DNA ligase-1